jgi:glycosyltransferase involved in cell wall biosynthesis
VYTLVRYRAVIIIPAFNEESTIKQVVNSVKNYGDVIVVNDASTDLTEIKAKEAGATVVNHTKNRGYDQALNSGFIVADKNNYDAIITFDADGQHSSQMLPEFINYIKNGKDLVLGIRPKTARFAEWIFMVYTRLKFDWRDPLCGMKGYSIALYRSQGYFDSYNSVGTELAIFGLKNSCSYVQLPISIEGRHDNPRFYSSIRSNICILKSMLNIR